MQSQQQELYTQIMSSHASLSKFYMQYKTELIQIKVNYVCSNTYSQILKYSYCLLSVQFVYMPFLQ